MSAPVKPVSPVVTPACPRCGKTHAMTADGILAGCAAVSAVDFNAQGKVTRIEFFPPVAPKPEPTVARSRKTQRAVEEVKTVGDKRVVTKVRTV